MATQREIWQNEHVKQETFTRIHSHKPSGPIPEFVQLISERGCIPGNTVIVDIGCGKGRNSIYLAKLGYKVKAFDFVPDAIEEARKRSIAEGVNIDLEVADLTERWSIGDSEANAIIDCNTTICIPNPSRKFAVKEARRILKKGGLYLFYGVARTNFVDASPGPEPNSAIFPKTGKFEKQYTKEELLTTYQDFALVDLKEIKGSDVIEGKQTEYSMWVAIFEKT
jgi:SAM-dependent methyltransferase